MTQFCTLYFCLKKCFSLKKYLCFNSLRVYWSVHIVCRGQRWCDGFAEKCCISSIPDLITLLYDYGWSPGCILMTQAHCCVHESTDTKFPSTT